jgi:hypothetical protein
MINIKLKNTNKLNEILKKLDSKDYEISNTPSLWKRFLIFIGLSKENSTDGIAYSNESNFEDLVTDSYIAKYPNDSRYRNLSISKLKNLKGETFTKYPELFDWEKISKLNLSSEFMITNFHLLNKNTISSNELPPEFIVDKYEDLKISTLFETNDMTKVYIYLHDSIGESNFETKHQMFLRYLNVWNVFKNYGKKLESLGRNDIVNKFIFSEWVSEIGKFDTNTKEDSVEEENTENV